MGCVSRRQFMTRGKDYYLSEIIDAAPVQLFTATNTAMMEYPYVLGRVGESSPTLSAQADIYIMDSGIGDDTETSDVVAVATKHDADIVVPCDVLGNQVETTEKTIEMLTQTEDMDVSVMIPLQENTNNSRVAHYQQTRDTANEYGFSIDDNPIAVGGVKDSGSVTQISEAIALRNAVGDNTHIHVFGGGATADWIATMRRCPDLIDSCDSSSISSYIINGHMINHKLDTVSFEIPRGSNSTALTTWLREFTLYYLNYLIGPYAREEDIVVEASSEVERLLTQYEL
jgi:hypothetical protein